MSMAQNRINRTSIHPWLCESLKKDRLSGSFTIFRFALEAKAINSHTCGSVGRCPKLIYFALNSPIRTTLPFG